MRTERKWVVNVPVATLWTSFDSARQIDKEAVSNPIELTNWLSKLTYDTLLELCEANLVQSQVLFGEEVIVISEKNGWAEVIVPSQATDKDSRGYPGWIPLVQLIECKDWNIETGVVAVVTAKKAKWTSEGKQKSLELSYQTMLPVIDQSGDIVKVKTPDGLGYMQAIDVEVFLAIENRKKGSGLDIVAAGEKFLDLPYLWGGMSSFGYDCSGFSYVMCKANGYRIPRDAGEQARAGKKVEFHDLKPGDLLFFAYEEGKGSLHHVGIYYGDGKLLHSPKTGKTVEIMTLSGTVLEKELCAASRYWQETEE